MLCFVFFLCDSLRFSSDDFNVTQHSSSVVGFCQSLPFVSCFCVREVDGSRFETTV